MLVVPEEVRYLGSARFSLGKILYYVSRLLTVPSLIFASYILSGARARLSETICQWFTWSTPITVLLAVFVSYWILTLRVIVLYERHKIVKALLYFTLFASYGTALGVQVSSMYKPLREQELYNAPTDMCVVVSKSQRTQIIFEVPFVFEVTLFLLLLYRGWHDYKASWGLSTIPVIRILYRDAVIFFIVTTAVRIWNIYNWVARPVYEVFQGAYVIASIVNVLACRIYLNILCAAQSPRVQELTQGLGGTVGDEEVTLQSIRTVPGQRSRDRRVLRDTYGTGSTFDDDYHGSSR